MSSGKDERQKRRAPRAWSSDSQGGVCSTTIETRQVMVHYVQDKALTVRLQQALVPAQQATGDGRVHVGLLFASGSPDGMVVMTLHDFLTWRRRRAVRKDKTEAASSLFLDEEG